MNEGYAPSRRADKVADWIEIISLQRGTAVASHSLEEAGVEHGYAAADVALGLNAVKRRARILEASYPFRTAGGGVAALPDSQAYTWVTLLLMSAESPLRSSLDVAVAAEHLERVCESALTYIYGPGTSAIRFGWPSEVGRPASFPEAVKWLADLMGVPVGSSYRPPYRKDGGVDVVAWKPFVDRRSGFPVLLTQCTLERDFSHKAGDIDVRVWSGWLALDTDPSTALALPEVVPAGEEWNGLAARTVVLDRIRLTSLMGRSSLAPTRLAPVMAWTEQQLHELRLRP